MRSLHLAPFLALLLLPAQLLAWELALQDQDANALVLTKDSAPIVEGTYVFWGPSFKWAGARVTPGQAGADASALKVAVAGLGVSIDAQVGSAAPAVYSWKMKLDVERELEGIVGGGIEFKLQLDSPALGGFKSEPVLLEDKTGWKWEVARGQFVSVVFSRPLPLLAFERGRKNQIRCLFMGADVPAGQSELTMTVTLPAGGKLGQSLDQRYGPAQVDKWLSNAMDPSASFIDLSELNEKPAGKRGFVKAKGDQFVLEDGTPIRFWGGNVQAYSLFVSTRDGKPDKQLIDAQAKRIAQLGFNLMRLHHHDSGNWVKTNLIAAGANSQQINEQALDTYFYWVKALKENGVYVWVDLHVGRPFKAGDEIPGFDEIRKGKEQAEGKGFCYLNPRLEQLMQQFNETLLTRKNPHTGLALKDDPAVMGVLLSNENDITHHFGNAFLGDKGNPHHQKIFEVLAQDFAARHKLSAADVGRTWVPGASKLLLNEIEYAWSKRMADHLRKLGLRVPITSGHLWGGCPHFSLPAQTAGDFIDIHAYEQGEFLSTNPRVRSNFAQYIAAGQLADRPLSITEYNVEPPDARDPHTMPLYVAALGAFQGWDAPMIYGYSQDSFRGGWSPWSSYNLPHVTGLMPAAAVMFRQGHVSGAKETKVVQLTRETAFLQSTSVNTSRALRTLPERHRLVIALPDAPELAWDRATPVPAGAQVVTDLQQDFIPAGQDAVESDTGELRRDWKEGVFTVNTPRSVAASGWIGGKTIALGPATFAIGSRKATVVLTSLDGKPLNESKRILLSTAARAQRSGQTIASEPVEGQIALKSGVALKIFPLLCNGTRGEALALKQEQGAVSIPLAAAAKTHWYLLSAE